MGYAWAASIDRQLIPFIIRPSRFDDEKDFSTSHRTPRKRLDTYTTLQKQRHPPKDGAGLVLEQLYRLSGEAHGGQLLVREATVSATDSQNLAPQRVRTGRVSSAGK